MRLKTITKYEELQELEQEWNALLSSKGAQPLPLTHQWISHWWNNFGSNRQLHICCFYQDNKVVAIAPLMRETSSYRGVKCNVLKLMANGHSPYSDIIFTNSVDSEQRFQIIDSLINNSHDISVFTKIPETGELFSELQQYSKKNDYKYGVTDGINTPVLNITNDWDTFFKSRSRKFRKGIVNKINKFDRYSNYHISLERIENSQSPVLDEIIEISKKSWKASIKNDLASNKASRNFLLGLTDAFGSKSKVQAWIARDGKIPMAYEYHIVHDSIVYPLRADFDEGYRDASPGSVLEFLAIKALFDDPTVTQYYSCADNYKYLRHWTDETKKHSGVEVFNKSKKAAFLHSLEYRLMPRLRKIRGYLVGEGRGMAHTNNWN